MKRISLALILLALTVFSACKLPATGIPSTTPFSEVAYTEAVMTIVAGYTQTAQAPRTAEEQALPTPTVTEIVQATATQAMLISDTPPVPSNTPTVILSPTQVPTTPVSTLPASDPRAGLGEPAFKDSFDNAQNWPIYTDEHVKIIIEDGKMIMTAKKPDFFNSWVLTWPKPANFYLEATATSGACGGKDRFGLIFRVPDVSVSNGYLFAFSCSGMYSIWYWDGEKETDLIDWKMSEYIHQGEGQTNRIGVQAGGDHLTLFANGNQISTLTDSRQSEGYFGVFVGSAQTENYTASFDEIAYWNIK